MCGYVLRNNRNGKFVAVPGHHSFTTDLRKARRFRTRGAAQENACGDECAIEIEELLTDYHA